MEELVARAAEVISRRKVRRAYLFVKGEKLVFVVELEEPNLFELAGLWGDLKDELGREVEVWATEERSPLGGVLIYDERLGALKPVH